MNLLNVFQDFFTDAFWSALAATGFAVLFSVPKRTLLGCALCGALGHALRMLLITQLEITIILATLLAAILVGFLGAYFAQRCRAPALIFSVSGAIPMVPGVFAYQTMLGVFDLVTTTAQDGQLILSQMSINALNTALILGAIALGIITPQLIFQRRKPVV